MAQVEHKRNRKTGGLTYRDQRLPEPTPSSSLSLTPAVFRSTPAMSGLGAGGDGNGGASDSDDEPCAFPHARGLTQPRTADELAHVLAQLKPGKKILKVAGEIDITETFVTEVVVQRDTPARSASCPSPLPSPRLKRAAGRLTEAHQPGYRARPRRHVRQRPPVAAHHPGEPSPHGHVAHRLALAAEAGPHVRALPRFASCDRTRC